MGLIDDKDLTAMLEFTQKMKDIGVYSFVAGELSVTFKIEPKQVVAFDMPELNLTEEQKKKEDEKLMFYSSEG